MRQCKLRRYLTMQLHTTLKHLNQLETSIQWHNNCKIKYQYIFLMSLDKQTICCAAQSGRIHSLPSASNGLSLSSFKYQPPLPSYTRQNTGNNVCLTLGPRVQLLCVNSVGIYMSGNTSMHVAFTPHAWLNLFRLIFTETGNLTHFKKLKQY